MSIINKELKVIIGSVVFALSINILIMPWNIYNGGMTGLAQIINDILTNHIVILSKLRLIGTIAFFINLPFFIFAWKKMSKELVILSLLSIITQSISLTLIPIPKEPIIDELFFSITLAALIGGVGVSMILNANGTSGGLDVLGIYLTEKKGMTVGKIYIFLNSLIYLYCLFRYDIRITIYSFVYSFMYAKVIDYFHENNTLYSVMVFTENNELKTTIEHTFSRDHNSLTLSGNELSKESKVIMCIVSSADLSLLESLVKQENDNTYILINKKIKVSSF